MIVATEVVIIALVILLGSAVYMLALSPGARTDAFRSGRRMLCVRFGYTPSELYTQLREYTDEERRLYLGHLRVDRVFIFFYGIPLIIFVLFAGERVAVLMPVHPWLALLPVAAGIADWIEDARLTSIAIRLFAKDTGELIEPAPQLDDRVRTASNTTRAKWFLVALSGTVGIGGVLLAAIGGLATAK